MTGVAWPGSAVEVSYYDRMGHNFGLLCIYWYGTTPLRIAVIAPYKTCCFSACI